MLIWDFSDHKQRYEREYGGVSGRKLDIEIDGEKWFLKFPGNIRDQVNDMSYSSSPLSEYIGSHIYQMLGYSVHDTRLGVYNNKLVVACKDFVQEGMSLVEFGKLKTTFVPDFLDSTGNETNGNGTDLEDVLQTIRRHPVLKNIPNIVDYFWNMFVVDAFIGNNDRNNGNWGVLRAADGSLSISPVYDNGASLLPKSSLEKIVKNANDPAAFANIAYKGTICIFKLNDHLINPIKFLRNTTDPDCLAAIEKNISLIRDRMSQIREFICEIPESFKGVDVQPQIIRDFHIKLLEQRLEYGLMPIFENMKRHKIEHEIEI